ncbi:MAG: endonuclease/exonuclease/phosphatase family protein, partial [Micromonosporaceae bacterium]|nr:endonuclease/exonuclease/phosphatase family protein [Micromonosporaceae bacterium]
MAAMPVFGSDGSTCEADPAGAGAAERPGPGPGPGRMRRTLLGLLVWVPSVLMATWAVARTFGLERSTYPVQLVSFTPYVAAASIVPLIVGLCLRRWIPAGVAAVAFAALIACVAPRAIPSSSESLTTSSRPTLRVMTHNVYLGKASASALVDRIRQERIDVLALQELTESMIGDLDRAGIAEFLPYRSLNALGGASGTGV